MKTPISKTISRFSNGQGFLFGLNVQDGQTILLVDDGKDMRTFKLWQNDGFAMEHYHEEINKLFKSKQHLMHHQGHVFRALEIFDVSYEEYTWWAEGELSGAAATPVWRYCTMCCATRNILLSNKPERTKVPLPVCWRSHGVPNTEGVVARAVWVGYSRTKFCA